MKEWNAKEYKESFSFVTDYGNDVTKLLDLKENFHGLDVGCGNGTLTNTFVEKGIIMDGLDQSKEMIDLAKISYPNINYINDSITSYYKDDYYDFIFSNACFHWISDQKQAIKNVYRSLKEKGQFVLEFGGYKCGHMVHQELEKEFTKRGLEYHFPFYFRKVGEFSNMLEAEGFIVKYATLFDRPTPLKPGNDVREWINMFVTEPFKGIDDNTKQDILNSVYNTLKPLMCNQNDIWIIDYTRIRIKAIKE